VIPLWRLTRNRMARRIYDRLKAAGITATRMIEFATGLSASPGREGPADRQVPGVSFVVVPPGEGAPARLEFDDAVSVSRLDGEWAVVATAEDRMVGRVLVSVDRSPYVDPLGETVVFDGAYVRRVYVSREWRNNGIATRLVGEATAVATDRLGEDSAHALIAGDNRPSQRAFAACGFRPVRRHDYVRLFGVERRRVTDLDRNY